MKAAVTRRRVLWLVALLLSVATAGYNWISTRSSRQFAPPGVPVRVRVTGRNFAWHFRYAGPDGRFETPDDVLVDDGQLQLPLGADVILELTSEDFVYTLSIPQLHLRQIAVPELTFGLPFHAERRGSSPIVADPLCAVRLFHDEKMGSVKIAPSEEFEAWVAKRRGW